METTSRAAAVAMGIRLEAATVVWMAAEAAIALIAALWHELIPETLEAFEAARGGHHHD